MFAVQKTHRRWGYFIAICCLAFSLSQISLSPQPLTEDESLLRSLVERFFAAYAREDLKEFMALWSEKSPDYEQRKRMMQQIFANADYAFSNLNVTNLKVDGEKARLQVNVELTEIKHQTNEQNTRKLVLVFIFVKEEGIWKIWRYYPPAEELAIALIEAKTEEEQEELLAKGNELVTPELVQILLILGDRQCDQENFSQALNIYRLAHSIAKRIDDMVLTALSMKHIGDAHALMLQYKEALEAYEASVRILRESVSQLQESGSREKVTEVLRLTAGLLHDLGIFYKDHVGDAKRALVKFQEALAIGREIGDREIEAAELNNIGGVHVDLGKFAQGLQEMEESVRIYEELLSERPERNLYRWYLVTLNHLACAYGSLHLYPQSFSRYEKSLKISREIGDKVGEMGALWGIGSTYLMKGDHANAKAYYEQSLKLAQEEGHLGWVVTNLGSLIDLHIKLGDNVQALAYAKENLKATKQSRSLWWEIAALTQTGSILVRLGDLEGAIACAEEAKQKLEYLEASLDEISFLFGDIYRAQRKWQQAIDAYRKFVEHFEKKLWAIRLETKMLEFVKVTEVYSNMAVCLSALNRTEEALQVSERMRARILSEILRKGKIDITKAMTEEEKRKERELDELIARLNLELKALQSQSNPAPSRLREARAKLDAARQDYDAFRRSLYLRHPDLAAQRGEVPPLTVNQIIRWLKDLNAQNTLVLEYLVRDDQILLFALNGTGKLEVYPIKITRKELERRINAFRSAIRRKEEGKIGALPEIEKTLKELNILIRPVTQMLAKVRQVCIVPDDLLWEVPFAALKTTKGKYLVEICSVFYAPSITALKAMSDKARQKRHLPSKTLMAMAPFAYLFDNRQSLRTVPLRGTFGALPASLREAVEVSQLYGAKPYLRREATESRFKTEGNNVRILHFATHTLLEPLDGMYSSILMAEEEMEDGCLEVREIIDMDLKAELTVLSACETARGQWTRGEGIIGLSWAFFVAGCPSTIVTQWKVKDESTAQLMLEFHRHLKAGKEKAESLRQAQLSLMRSPKYSHPFYWAPFMLVGDWH